MTYRIAVKHLTCGLHFDLYSWEEGKHTAASLYCPECGQRDGNFLVWKEETAKQIFEFVPGDNAKLVGMPTKLFS